MQATAILPSPMIDRNRFSELIHEHHRSLLAYSTALSKSDATARDLLQDSCLVAWQNVGKFDITRDFATWMRGILRNKWREHCRKYKRETMLDEETLERLEAVFHTNDNDAVIYARLADCRAKLPEPMHEAITACYDEGRSSDEAATVLKTTAAALRKRLERAREALRICLGTTK